MAVDLAADGLGVLAGGAGVWARGGEPQALAGEARVNGHGWQYMVVIGAASFAAGILWSLHANDAAQDRQLTDLEARAVVARGSFVDTMQRLADLEHEFELFKQRMEARP